MVMRRVAARFRKKKRKSLGIWAAGREREWGQNGGWSSTGVEDKALLPWVLDETIRVLRSARWRRARTVARQEVT